VACWARAPRAGRVAALRPAARACGADGLGGSCSLWQQKLVDQESKSKAFASEICQLRTELENVLKKAPAGAPRPTLELPACRPAATGPGPLSLLTHFVSPGA
jgi:hypothetical protein